MVISLDHVVYVYPDGTPALRDVSLGIAAGERVAEPALEVHRLARNDPVGPRVEDPGRDAPDRDRRP